jgi:cytochrome oxidase Cu insertion factor (SCO1/SenC/PrrC family)
MRPGAVIRLAGSVFLAGWLLATACAPVAPAGDGTPDTSGASVPVLAGTDVPVLAGELTANCQPDEKSGGGMGRGLKVGETAIDFTLEDINGTPVSLSGLLAKRPVVMVFGAFT